MNESERDVLATAKCLVSNTHYMQTQHESLFP